ncbi:hypothetical protein PCC8801_0390 [Rippkaea orientalis PCC 8801]|uniref:DUF2541 family protein n=1 Tax=Rippkaea orientalis (strain PCC 8801 / RF-1) TaxID=41431 RepID=B7JUA8_RIPO1|nr:hypothetical protein [Rippkaea orientalis]ACK64488.1 hypothetical protein PCC8801_0390 [Rippkaea orientalis PCC 8801]
MLISVGFSHQEILMSQVQAQQEWGRLGERSVGAQADRDTIIVTGSQGTFRQLKFVVLRHPIRIYRIVVHYGNGRSETIETRELIRAGSESRVINLRGGDRVIKKIDFWYETKSLGKNRAIIRVYGRS